MITKTCMKQKLENGEVNFTFDMVHGGQYEARGTLNPKTVKAAGGKIKKGWNPIHENTMTYFDLDENDWRSFRFANLRNVQ